MGEQNAVVTVTAGLTPIRSIEEVAAQRNSLVAFMKTVMVEGIDRDYGVIPGTPKATLFLPGAQKLCQYFGLTPHYTLNSKIEDWTGAAHGGEPLFFYDTKCELYDSQGMKVGEADGSCNSWEKKYRYRWVTAEELPRGANPDLFKQRGGRISEFEFAINKAETSGKYGKPAEYWQKFKDAIAAGTAVKVKRPTKNGTADAWEIDGTLYAVPNEDVFDQVNTFRKISAKRAFVGAVINAVGAAEFVTQDLEDVYIDAVYTVVEDGSLKKEEFKSAATAGATAGNEKEAETKAPSHQANQEKTGQSETTSKANGKPAAPKMAELTTEQRRAFMVKLKEMGLTYDAAKQMLGVESMKDVDLTEAEVLAKLAGMLKEHAVAPEK